MREKLPGNIPEKKVIEILRDKDEIVAIYHQKYPDGINHIHCLCRIRKDYLGPDDDGKETIDLSATEIFYIFDDDNFMERTGRSIGKLEGFEPDPSSSSMLSFSVYPDSVEKILDEDDYPEYFI